MDHGKANMVEQTVRGLTWGEFGAIAACGTLLLAVVAYLVGLGRRQGVLETDVKQTSMGLIALREDYERDTREMRQEIREDGIRSQKRHDDFMTTFHRAFLTDDGEARFITGVKHDKICTANQDNLQLRLDHICGNVSDIKEIVQGEAEKAAASRQDIAVLKEWKENNKGTGK